MARNIMFFFILTPIVSDWVKAEKRRRKRNGKTELRGKSGATAVSPDFCCASADTWPRRRGRREDTRSTSPVTLRQGPD